MNGRNTGLCVFFNGARNIGRAAIACIGIGDDRDADRAHHIPRMGGHFRLAQQPDIWPAQPRCRGTKAGHVNRLKPRLFDQARGQAIGGAGGGDDTTSLESLAKSLGSDHGISPKATRQMRRV